MPAHDGAPPDFAVKLNGAPLPGFSRDVVTVRVEDGLDAISTATLELVNWDPGTQRHTWSDARELGLGAALEISLGYVDDVQKVFSGEIVGLEPAWSAAGGPRVTVRAFDHGHRLARATDTRAFSRMKDSGLAERVAREFGLRPTITDTKVTIDYVLQSNQTALDFLRDRARRYGYEVFVRDRALHFRPPAMGSRPVATLHVGEEIDEFTARLSGDGRAGTVRATGWDVRRKQVVAGTAQTGSLDAMGGTLGLRTADAAFGRATVSTVTVPLASKQEADALALGRLTASALGYVEAEAEGDGRPDLRSGTTVTVEGAGTRFSGTYYVVEVVHSLTAGRYRTALQLRRTSA